MDNGRIAKMAERVAQGESGADDEPLAMVDQAIDMMIASAKVLDENLGKIETENVAQRAAVDEVRSLMDEAVAPYLADVVKAMAVFGD